MNEPRPKRSVLSWKQRFKATDNPDGFILDAQHSLDASGLDSFIPWLAKHPEGRRYTLAQWPEDLHDIRKEPLLPRPPTVPLVAWYSRSVATQIHRLRSFRDSAREFEELDWIGEAETALDKLDSIERDFGPSIWSVENRISVLQTYYGLEAQKAFVRKITHDKETEGLFGFLIHHISVRNEPTISVGNFIEGLTINTDSSPASIRSYAHHHLANKFPSSREEVGDILWLESVSSPIDFYETCVSMFLRCVSTDALRALTPHFFPIVQAAQGFDYRLAKGAFVLGEWKQDDFFVPRNTNFRNAFLSGSRLSKDEQDSSLDIATICDQAELGLEPSAAKDASRSEEIYKNVFNLYWGDANQSKIAAEAAKRQVLNNRHLSWSAGLRAAVARETTSEPPRLRHDFDLAAFLWTPLAEPEDIYLFRETANETNFLLFLAREFDGQASLGFALCRAGHPSNAIDGVLDELVAVARVDALLTRNLEDQALEILEDLSSSNRRIQNEITRYHSYCLLKLDEIKGLFQLVARSISTDPKVARYLPLDTLPEVATPIFLNKNASDIAIPVTLQMHVRHTGGELANLRNDAYEDFLLAHNVQRPSELPSTILDHDRPLAAYYLRELCVPSIMHFSTVFQGTQDLERERVEVCRILSKIDPGNLDAYEAEITEISFRHAIEQGVQRVEQSKIYVDIDRVRDWAASNVSAAFRRYQDLSKAGLGFSYSETSDVISKPISGGDLKDESVALPSSEGTTIFVSLVSAIFRQLLLSDHGLDSYLSMRVRHGTMSGKLRRPLEKEKIITQRNEQSGIYEENSFWIAKLGLTGEKGEQVDAAFRRFSERIDRLIQNLLSILHVKSQGQPDGFFSYPMAMGEIKAIASSVPEEATFDEFLSLIIRHFWSKTDHLLEELRKAINVPIKKAFVGECDDLISELESVFENEQFPAELRAAILAARVKLLAQLDQTGEWFRRSDARDDAEHDLRKVITVAISAEKNIHATFLPDEEIEAPDNVIIHSDAVDHVYDILHVIFDNVARRSQLDRPKLRISAELTDSKVKLMVANSVAEAARTPAHHEKLDAIRQQIADDEIGDSVRREGGSGLFKLWHLVHRIDGWKTNFGFDGGWFRVQIDIPTTG